MQGVILLRPIFMPSGLRIPLSVPPWWRAVLLKEGHMRARFEAVARAVRSLVQGAVAAAAVAAWQAGQAAFTDAGWQPRILVVAAVSAFITAVVSYVYNAVAPRLGMNGSPSVEAFIRAGRTLFAGAVSTGMLAAWDAASSAWQSGAFSLWVVGSAAVTAGVTAVVAYVHTLVQPRKVGR